MRKPRQFALRTFSRFRLFSNLFFYILLDQHISYCTFFWETSIMLTDILLPPAPGYFIWIFIHLRYIFLLGNSGFHAASGRRYGEQPSIKGTLVTYPICIIWDLEIYMEIYIYIGIYAKLATFWSTWICRVYGIVLRLTSYWMLGDGSHWISQTLGTIFWDNLG